MAPFVFIIRIDYFMELNDNIYIGLEYESANACKNAILSVIRDIENGKLPESYQYAKLMILIYKYLCVSGKQSSILDAISFLKDSASIDDDRIYERVEKMMNAVDAVNKTGEESVQETVAKIESAVKKSKRKTNYGLIQRGEV